MDLMGTSVLAALLLHGLCLHANMLKGAHVPLLMKKSALHWPILSYHKFYIDELYDNDPQAAGCHIGILLQGY
jgi:hypothetical protein